MKFPIGGLLAALETATICTPRPAGGGYLGRIPAVAIGTHSVADVPVLGGLLDGEWRS